MKSGIEPGYARVTIHGRTRLVPIQGNRVFVTRQRTGEVAGHTAALAYVPIEAGIDLLKAAGRAIASSPEGQGFQYGWYQRRRGFEVSRNARALEQTSTATWVRSECVRRGLVSMEQGIEMDIRVLTKMLADYRTHDKFLDNESFIFETTTVENPKGDEEVPYSVTEQVESIRRPDLQPA